MKFVTFSIAGQQPQPGVFMEAGIFPLPFTDLLEVIRGGTKAIESILQLLRDAPVDSILSVQSVRMQAPLPKPVSMRDFYAFEAHVAAANANRGRGIPPTWYDMPVFYFTNPGEIFGPDDVIPYPSYTHEMDYELEIAAVIGKTGINIAPEDAPEYIFGFCIMNDWSARDEQRRESSVGLGPAKGKDFATSLGPWIVTLDELDKYATGRPGIYDLEMTASINGKARSSGCFADIHYSFGELIARASRDAHIFPGDVIGSGTVGTGCLLELTKGKGPWLQPGDVIELKIEGLGALRNIVGEPA